MTTRSTRPTRRRTQTALTLATAAASIAPATVVGAEPVAPPPDRADPSVLAPTATGPVLASGTIAVDGGSTAPDGTRIDVYRAPGAEQALVPLTSTRTSAGGAFTLRADPGVLADGNLHTLSVVVSSPAAA